METFKMELKNQTITRDNGSDIPKVIKSSPITSHFRQLGNTLSQSALGNAVVGKNALCEIRRKAHLPYLSCQKDEIGFGPYDEPREYLAFIKSQARQIQQGRLTVEEADYRILAKGNEIEQRFKEEFAAAERKQQMQRRRTITIDQPPPIPNYSQPQFTGPNAHELIMRCQGAVDFVTGRCIQ
jgi:hypothetical protein